MNDYSEMSDFEINKRIAHQLGFIQQGRGWITGADGVYDYIARPNDDYRVALPNYCNSWADAGPIIQASAITVACFKHSQATAWDSSKGLAFGSVFNHPNPLRAAMIVFLMMKGAEK